MKKLFGLFLLALTFLAPASAEAAARFWVGGTGVYSDTAHWSATSGGAGGQTVPGTGDTVTIDAHASGLNGGTLTVDQTITVQSISWGAAIGTIDNIGNFNVTVSSATIGFNGSGTGARTWIGGSGTYTLSAATSLWTMTTITSLTNPTTAFSSTSIVFSGNSSVAPHVFAGGGLTYGNVTFNGQSSRGGVSITGANTYAALTVLAPNWVQLPQATTQTVTSLVANDGTFSNPIYLESNNTSGQAVISDASGTNTLDGVGLRGISFTGGATFVANNSYDYGRNAGITITPPSAGGGGGRIIGG